jgi:hypothetical protein
MSEDLETLRKSIGETLSELMSCVEGFRARILARLESEPASSRADGPACGGSSPAASTRSVRATPSSRTSPASSPDSTTCSPVPPAAPSAETSSPTTGTSSPSSTPTTATPESTWRPSPWPNSTEQSARRSGSPSAPGSAPFAFLAAGAWVIPQASLCGRAGWDEYSETWPLSGTMRSGSAYRRRPLAPRTSATEPSLWPTPNAHEECGERYSEETMKRHMAEGRQVHLGQMIKHNLKPETFPTPMASGAGTSPETLEMVLAGESQMTLDRYVKLWPTPCTKDADFSRYTAEQREAKGQQVMLCNEVLRKSRLWPPPMAQEGPGGQVAKLTDMVEVAEGRMPKYYRGKETDSLESSDERLSSGGPSGQLNPTWVEWLMGFPPGWTDCGASVTPSSPKWPTGSGGASSTTPETFAMPTAADAKASEEDGFSPLGRQVVRGNPKRKAWSTPRASDAGGQSLNATIARIKGGGDVRPSSLVKWGERGQLDGIAEEPVDGEDPGGLFAAGAAAEEGAPDAGRAI